MFHCFQWAVLSGIPIAVGISAACASDELQSTSSNETASVSEVVANWSAAVAANDRVDVEFTRYVYDLSFETVTPADGRLVCERGFRQYLSLRPYTGKIQHPRKKRSGAPFDVRSGGSERWVLDKNECWSIDDDAKEALHFVIGQPSRRATNAEDNGPFSEFVIRLAATFSADAFALRFATIGQIGGAHPHTGSRRPVLDETFKDRFQITIIRNDVEHTFLHLVPKSSQDAAFCSHIDVQLSRQTWLPDAIRFDDPAGTTQTVYVFGNRRINDCPERTQHLFNLDLTGYKVQSISSAGEQPETAQR